MNSADRHPESSVTSEEVTRYLAPAAFQIPLREQVIADVRRDHRLEEILRGGPPECVTVVDDISIGHLPARLYFPTGRETQLLVWLHGGAWMMGDLDCCDYVARALANRAKCAVMSVAYRLAPEHPYPAAVEDAWTATLWARERFAQIAVGGDSSGGNLAAVTALGARDAGFRLAMQLLIYPVLDWRPNSADYQAYSRDHETVAGISGFGRWYEDAIAYMWETYIPDATMRRARTASPLQAESLVGVAPTFLVSAEHDILRQQGEEYTARLRASAVATATCHYGGQVHGFFPLLGTFTDARHAVASSAYQLRSAFDAQAQASMGSH
jgi:acetyl esterase